jgi:hypothetical protein
VAGCLRKPLSVAITEKIFSLKMDGTADKKIKY